MFFFWVRIRVSNLYKFNLVSSLYIFNRSSLIDVLLYQLHPGSSKMRLFLFIPRYIFWLLGSKSWIIMILICSLLQFSTLNQNLLFGVLSYLLLSLVDYPNFLITWIEFISMLRLILTSESHMNFIVDCWPKNRRRKAGYNICRWWY